MFMLTYNIFVGTMRSTITISEIPDRVGAAKVNLFLCFLKTCASELLKCIFLNQDTFLQLIGYVGHTF